MAYPQIAKVDTCIGKFREELAEFVARVMFEVPAILELTIKRTSVSVVFHPMGEDGRLLDPGDPGAAEAHARVVAKLEEIARECVPLGKFGK